jgi:tetratricopeptide (TPR) repeat protein
MARVNWIALIGVACLCGSAGHAGDDAVTVVGVNSNLAEGADALEHNEYREGIRRTEDGLRSSLKREDRVGAFSNLCAGHVGTGEYDEALRYCNRALRLDVDNWHAYNNRSLAYLGLGDIDSAQRDVDKGLQLNPGGRTLLIVQNMVNEAAAKKAALPHVSSPPEERN